MLTLLSPAKNLNESATSNGFEAVLPEFHLEALPLVKKLKRMSKPALMKLMNISQSLAELNKSRYDNFKSEPRVEDHQAAIMTFAGDVYRGFDAATLSHEQLTFANKHIRILSGMYGILKPLSYIQPYRLEMGSKLPIGRKKNLYAYWKEKVTKNILDDIKTNKFKAIINLASKEYAKVVDFSALQIPTIEIHFREWRNDQLKAIQFNLKRARGLMARFIVENEITELNQLKAFDTEGYLFDPERSDDNNWYFIK